MPCLRRSVRKTLYRGSLIEAILVGSLPITVKLIKELAEINGEIAWMYSIKGPVSASLLDKLLLTLVGGPTVAKACMISDHLLTLSQELFSVFEVWRRYSFFYFGFLCLHQTFVKSSTIQYHVFYSHGQSEKKSLRELCFEINCFFFFLFPNLIQLIKSSHM